MYRFFVKKDQIQEDAVIIIGSDVNHIKNVLRMKKGETILISDGEDREYVCTIDELAAIKNRDLYDLMKQSMSARRQPLLFCITTNGFVREGIFDAQYDYAVGVLEGKFEDDEFISFIYELDSLDEWDNPKMWIKANPGLGTIKNIKDLQGYVNKATITVISKSYARSCIWICR